MSSSDVATPDLVPGRSCGGCTMCCKLMEVEELEKPRATWCAKCDRSRGCTIYEGRPQACRTFHCGYLRLAYLDERWKPAKAKFLVNYEERARRIAIHVDPDRPDAWRKEPFLGQLRHWSAAATREGGYVIVWCGPRASIVLPDRVKELGQVRDDQLILETRDGGRRDFIAIEPDDPRGDPQAARSPD